MTHLDPISAQAWAAFNPQMSVPRVGEGSNGEN